MICVNWSLSTLCNAWNVLVALKDGVSLAGTLKRNREKWLRIKKWQERKTHMAKQQQQGLEGLVLRQKKRCTWIWCSWTELLSLLYVCCSDFYEVMFWQAILTFCTVAAAHSRYVDSLLKASCGQRGNTDALSDNIVYTWAQQLSGALTVPRDTELISCMRQV